MNTRRRKAIGKAIEDYLNKETAAREELRDVLEAVKDEESDAYENLPESIQDGEKGEAMQDAISVLEDILLALDDDPYYDETSALRETLGIEE